MLAIAFSLKISSKSVRRAIAVPTEFSYRFSHLQLSTSNSFMPGGYIPPVAFHFAVSFAGIGNDNDMRFQSVSGLSVEYETENIKEGGENRFEHKLPVRTRYSDLVLKRGLLTDSKVVKWVMDALQNRQFTPANVVVSLLNEKHEPLTTWAVQHAWPRKWSIAEFNSMQSAVAVESLELSYQTFTMTNLV